MGRERGRTQDRLYHECGGLFLFSVPEDPVGWMERMVEDGESYEGEDPVVGGQWGAFWWSDGGSVEEMANGGEFCSEDAICKYAGCHGRSWKDVWVRPGWGRGAL